ncbi:MAG: Gx transporter family protein [Lachnospiraceae bacterium]|nr:Gx transporter family protein [Lachnospiraceae bacterium]
MEHSSSTKHLTTLALFTTLALAIYGVESLLPPLLPIPGMKLGLANIITLLVLTKYHAKDAFLVLLARILLSTFAFGQAVSLLYSLCGGICCFAIMCLIKHLLRGKYLYITSIFGAIFHNLGQIMIALLLTRTIGVLSYLPFLIICAIATGLFTGLCAHFAIKLLHGLPQ